MAFRFAQPIGEPFPQHASRLAEHFSGWNLSSAKQVLSFILSFLYQNSGYAGIIVQLPTIHQPLVALEISDAMHEAATDNLLWNIMPALFDAHRHTLYRHFHIRQRQKGQVHRITGRTPDRDHPCIGQAGKCGLECKAHATFA